MSAVGASVVVADETPVPVSLPEVAAEVTVLSVDSLAVVGPTTLLETDDGLGAGAGMMEVELSGAGAGEVSEPGTVVVAVVAMVL